MLAAPMQMQMPTLPPMTTTSAPSSTPFQSKTGFYPSAPFLPFPMQTTSTLPPPTSTSYGYNSGCNGATTLGPLSSMPMAFHASPAVPHSTSNGYYAPEMNTHTTKYDDLSPKHAHNHLMPEQLSPPAEDDTHHQRTRINSADDNSISPLPASSPATGPLLSPNTISSHIRAPSSLNCSQAVKTTYNFAGNGLSNGFTYSGSRLATQHHLPQSNPSLPQSTPCPPFFAPPYPLTTCPQVATAPPTHPVTMSNVVFPFYSTHSGQDNYNSAPINSSAVNIWNPCYPNPLPKASYDSPRFKLTPERATPLQKWFDDHKEHPYPTRHDKILLCQETNLTFTQVSTWFANGRRRLKKATQEEEEKQSYGSSSGISSNGTSSSQPCAGPNSPRSSNSVTNSNEVEGKFHNNYDSKAPTKHVAEGKKSCYTKIGGHRSL